MVFAADGTLGEARSSVRLVLIVTGSARACALSTVCYHHFGNLLYALAPRVERVRPSLANDIGWPIATSAKETFNVTKGQ
jgi:hypothetical protein